MFSKYSTSRSFTGYKKVQVDEARVYDSQFLRQGSLESYRTITSSGRYLEIYEEQT